MALDAYIGRYKSVVNGDFVLEDVGQVRRNGSGMSALRARRMPASSPYVNLIEHFGQQIPVVRGFGSR